MISSKLRAAITTALESDGGVEYNSPEDSVGGHCCCGTLSYAEHSPSCWVIALREAVDSEPTWTPVSERLPESGVPVLVYVVSPTNPKRSRRLRAQYAGKFALEHTGDDDTGEYDEATDTFYCQEGWYEDNENEETHWYIGDTITHWMPLPEPPEIKS